MKVYLHHKDEARVFDAMAGYHSFHAEETQNEYGSFLIFWHDGCENYSAGWYWQAEFAGCLPDSEEKTGPFASSYDAHFDANPWHPDYE